VRKRRSKAERTNKEHIYSEAAMLKQKKALVKTSNESYFPKWRTPLGMTGRGFSVEMQHGKGEMAVKGSSAGRQKRRHVAKIPKEEYIYFIS
jgi:hypothetical protein